MNTLFDIAAYRLECDWLLTWFPTRRDSAIDTPHVRGGALAHRTNEGVFDVGNHVDYGFGQGAGDSGDPFSSPIVTAFLAVRVNKAGLFEVDLDMGIGNTRRKETLPIPPGETVPFLLTVQSRGDEAGTRNTGLAFQGVIVGGERLGLLDVIQRFVGP